MFQNLWAHKPTLYNGYAFDLQALEKPIKIHNKCTFWMGAPKHKFFSLSLSLSPPRTLLYSLATHAPLKVCVNILNLFCIANTLIILIELT